MSGGSFDYKQYQLSMLLEEVKQEFLEQSKSNENERYSKETLKKFKKAIKFLKKAYVYVCRIDYLISGDDSEESFHKRLKKELINLK